MTRKRKTQIDAIVNVTKELLDMVSFGRKMIPKILEWLEKLGEKMFFDGTSGKFYRLLTCSECQKLELKRLYISVRNKPLAQRRNLDDRCQYCRQLESGRRFAKTTSGIPRTEEWRNNLSKGQIRALKTGRRKGGRFGKLFVIDGVTLRSGLEANYYLWLKLNGIGAIVGPRAISFIKDGRVVRYLPDFYRLDTKRYCEVKPSRFLTESEMNQTSRIFRKNNIWKVQYLQSKGVPIDFVTEVDGWYDRRLGFLLKKYVNKKTRIVNLDGLLKEYKEKLNGQAK